MQICWSHSQTILSVLQIFKMRKSQLISRIFLKAAARHMPTESCETTFAFLFQSCLMLLTHRLDGSQSWEGDLHFDGCENSMDDLFSRTPSAPDKRHKGFKNGNLCSRVEKLDGEWLKLRAERIKTPASLVLNFAWRATVLAVRCQHVD